MANGRIRTFVLVGAVVTLGVLAGLFYTFSVAVMPGLADADDRTLVDAMQRINDAIENPVFFLAFLGAPALTIAALVMERRSGSAEVVRWLVAALVLYGVMFIVTGALNIPLNDDLADAGDPAQIRDLTGVRDDFEDPWVAWNTVRTLASTAAVACIAWALYLYGAESRPGRATIAEGSAGR